MIKAADNSREGHQFRHINRRNKENRDLPASHHASPKCPQNRYLPGSIFRNICRADCRFRTCIVCKSRSPTCRTMSRPGSCCPSPRSRLSRFPRSCRRWRRQRPLASSPATMWRHFNSLSMGYSQWNFLISYCTFVMILFSN